MDGRSSALALIEGSIFSDVHPSGEFHGISVYDSVPKAGPHACIGLSSFILVDESGNARWSVYDEIMERLHAASSSEDDE